MADPPVRKGLCKIPGYRGDLKITETFMLFRHNYLDGQYIKDTTNLTQSQVDTVLNLGGTSEAKNMESYVWLTFLRSAQCSSRRII